MQQEFSKKTDSDQSLESLRLPDEHKIKIPEHQQIAVDSDRARSINNAHALLQLSDIPETEDLTIESITKLFDLLEKNPTLAALYGAVAEGKTVRQYAEYALKCWSIVSTGSRFPNAIISEKEFILILALLNSGEGAAESSAVKMEKTWNAVNDLKHQLPLSENGWKAAELLIRHRLIALYIESFIDPVKPKNSEENQGRVDDHSEASIATFQRQTKIRSTKETLTDALARVAEGVKVIKDIRRFANALDFHSSAALDLMLATYKVDALIRTRYAPILGQASRKFECDYIFDAEFLAASPDAIKSERVRFGLAERIVPFFKTLEELDVIDSGVLTSDSQVKALYTLKYFRHTPAAKGFSKIQSAQRQFLKVAEKIFKLDGAETNDVYARRERLIAKAVAVTALPSLSALRKFSEAAEKEATSILHNLATDAWEGRLGSGKLTVLPVYKDRNNGSLKTDVADFLGERWPLDANFVFARYLALSGSHGPGTFCDNGETCMVYPSKQRIAELVSLYSHDDDFYDYHSKKPRFSTASILAKNYDHVAVPQFVLTRVGEIRPDELGEIFQYSHHHHSLNEWATVLTREQIEKFWPPYGNVVVGKLYQETSMHPDGGFEVRLQRLPTGRYALLVPGYFGDFYFDGGPWGDAWWQHDERAYYVGAVTSPMVSIRRDFFLSNDRVEVVDEEILPLTDEERSFITKDRTNSMDGQYTIFRYRSEVPLTPEKFPAFKR